MLGHAREGETPLQDLSGLKLRHIRNRSQLDAAEITNIQSALLRYMTRPPNARDAPFDVAWLLRLHRQMLGQVWTWAGTPRRHGTNIGVDPMHIEVRLHELCADLHAWQQSRMPLLEQGARLHHRAVSIHPFTNGNGRWSRLLANIWLLRHGRRVVRWPETVIGCESPLRSDYLRAVREADGGDLEPLIAMHAAHESDPFAPD